MSIFRTPYDDDYVSPSYQRFDEDGNPIDINGDPEPSLTVQDQAEACDINSMLERYEKTGVITTMQTLPFDGDFTRIPDFQTALNAVMSAQAMFDSLPAKVRREFDNDPAKFLDFMDDPANADRIIELGLATSLPAEPDIKADSKEPPAA